jgi:hypothetical protein
MSGVQIFVGVFAIVSVALSVLAIWRVATSSLSYKLFWIIGSAFGFVGVAADFGHSGDLYLQFGIQIPVIMIFWLLPGGGPIVKAMFPFIAAAALVKRHSCQSAPGG